MAEISAFLIFSVILLVFTIHVVLLAIEIVISLLVFVFEVVKKQSYDFKNKVTKKYIKYVGLNYASQQAYLTASTVFVLSFYPEVLVLAGRALFYVLTFLITIFAIRLVFMAYYWYGWGRISEKLHSAMAIFWTLTGVILLYLDTLLLGFLGNPVGVESLNLDTMVPKMNYAATFLNPISFALLPLLVVFAVTIVLNLLAYIHILRVEKIKDEDLNEENYLALQYRKVAFIAAPVILPILIIYLVVLYFVAEYKFQSLFGYNDAAESLNLLWMVGLAVLFYLAHLYYSFTWNKANKKATSLKDVSAKDKTVVLFQTLTIILSFAFLIIADFISQTPYFVMDTELAKDVPFINVTNGVNERAAVFDVYSVAVFGLLPLVAAFGVWLYFFFSGMLGDKPIEGKQLAGIIE